MTCVLFGMSRYNKTVVLAVCIKQCLEWLTEIVFDQRFHMLPLTMLRTEHVRYRSISFQFRDITHTLPPMALGTEHVSYIVQLGTLIYMLRLTALRPEHTRPIID